MSIFNTRLFLEGFQADLNDNLDITSTYTIDDVKDITSIASDFTKTITLPGTAKNSQLFNFLFDIKSSTTQTNPSYTGPNIGYNYSFVRKCKAVLTQDNQVVFDGYAQLISATVTDGLVSYSIQISSELTSLVSVLASYKLEDLYSSAFPTPYDHKLSLSGITASWAMPSVNPDPTNPQVFPFGKGYFYPIIDYGDGGNGNPGETTNATNFYTSNLRPCLFAKTYWDEIFDGAGFTYSSNFLNSEYFGNLIIPYKDGNMLTLSTSSLFTSQLTGSTVSQSIVPISGVTQGEKYIYNEDVSPLYLSQEFKPINNGQYDFTINYDVFFTFAPVTPIAHILVVSSLTMYGIVEVYNADNTLASVSSNNIVINKLDPNTYNFMGNTGTFTTPNTHIEITVPGVFMTVGQYAKIAVNSTYTQPELLAQFVFPNVFYVPGVGTANYLANTNTTLNVSFNNSLDINTIEFSQFVPKDVQQIDYITSILRLFNLYPIQDRDRPRHFNIYTRDEFYSNQIDTPSFTYVDKQDLDWTNKIDKSQDITITPIPNLKNGQLYYSYQADKDWFNTLYSSLYASPALISSQNQQSTQAIYGGLNINTGFEFSQDALVVLDGMIFSPTVPVQYGGAGTSNSTFPCEATVEILNASKDVLSVSGYRVATSGQTSLPSGNDGFTHARIGVQIFYLGQFYTIINVINPQSFQVDRPVSGRTQVDSTYYAAYDLFTYVTFNNKIIPAIYQTSDQNNTRTPVAVNPRILYYAGMRPCNTYYIQYTPVPGTSGLTATYPEYPYFISGNTYPFCSHLNDDVNPTNDLLFFIPAATYFPIAKYPSVNQFTNFFENEVNELTDPDAKMMTAKFKLNAIDISNRDLSNSIYIDGTKFRINEITDYVPDDSVLTSVELIRQPFQQYNTATVELVNQISGSTSSSNMTLTVAPNTGTTVLLYPNGLSSSSLSGSTGDVTGTLRGVPFGMGPSTFNLAITAPGGWSLTVTKNANVIATTSGIGNANLNISITDIEQGDSIVISAVAASTTLMNISVDDMNLGSLSSVTVNGSPVIYVSGSTFPMSAGQSGLYLTTQAGTGLTVQANYSSYPTSGSTITFDDGHGDGSSQGIPSGSGSITWAGQKFDGTNTSLNLAGAYCLIQISEDSNSHSNFTGMTVNGVAPIYISGSTFPMSGSTTALYKTPYTGTQTLLTSMNVSASGDTWTCVDTNPTTHTTTINSVGSGVTVNTNVALAPGGLATVGIAGFFNGSVSITNSYGSASITNINNLPGMSPSFPGITGSGSYSGTHNTGFTASIQAIRTGTVPTGSSFHVRLIVNGTQIDSIQADSTSSYNFVSHTFLRTDSIQITFST